MLALRFRAGSDAAIPLSARGCRAPRRIMPELAATAPPISCLLLWGWWPALLVCAIDGGAGGELPGHRDRRPRDRSAVRGLRRALSPTFPAGEMVFIPFSPRWGVGLVEELRRGASRPARTAWARRRRCCRFLFSDIPVRGDDGAWVIGANHRECGRRGGTGSRASPRPDRNSSLGGCPGRVRSLQFQAGGMVLFIRWRAAAL